MPTLTFAARESPPPSRRHIRRVELGRRDLYAHLARYMVRPLPIPPRRAGRRSEADRRCGRTICQRNRVEERRRMQQVVEAMPKRFVKAEDAAGTGERKAA